jgi:hypothetical protein
MRKTAYSLWFMVYGIFLLFAIRQPRAAVCYAQTAVSSTELIEQARDFDGKEVIYQGEAIGEAMARGDHFWVNLNDADNAVGIWVPDSFLSLVLYTGSYKSRGDWLGVRGVFNRACKLHGGDLDIHALQVVKLRNGRLVPHRLVQEKHTIVIILLGVLLCLLILQLLKKKPGKQLPRQTTRFS